MADESLVDFEVSLNEMFSGLLTDVAEENSFPIPDLSHQYLVSLLESFLFVGNLYSFDEETGAISEPMLTEQFLTALQESDESARSQKLRKLGESTLYKVGFFSESLKRKLVGMKFYIDIGKSAYESLYGCSPSPIYEDLGNRFSDYVDLFMGVSQKVQLNNPDDILNLFEHISERESKVAQRELLNRGIIPHKVKKASSQ